MSKKENRVINTHSILAGAMVATSIVGFYLGDVLLDTSTLDTTTMNLERVVSGLLTVISILALVFGGIAIYKTPTWPAKVFLIAVFLVGIVALGLNGLTFLLSGFVVPF